MLTEADIRDIEAAKALLGRVLRNQEMHQSRIRREEQEARGVLRAQHTDVEPYEERN